MKIVEQAAHHCAVDAKLIYSHLLNSEDKRLIESGVISKRDLIFAVIAWRDNGCPDYSEK